MSTNYPILLLHGALGSETSLHSLRKHLADFRKVYSFNFSGHGGRDFYNGGFGIDQFTNEVMAFLDMKQISKVSVFGYSMGGYVALNAAFKFPDRFANIMTLGTCLHWDEELALTEIAKMNPDKIREKVPAFAAQLESEHGNDWGDLLAATSDMIMGLAKHSHLTKEDIGQIKNSITVCVAEHDKLANPVLSKKIVDGLQNASFHLIKDAHHPFEKTPLAEVLTIIKDHL